MRLISPTANCPMLRCPSYFTNSRLRMNNNVTVSHELVNDNTQFAWELMHTDVFTLQPLFSNILCQPISNILAIQQCIFIFNLIYLPFKCLLLLVRLKTICMRIPHESIFSFPSQIVFTGYTYFGHGAEQCVWKHYSSDAQGIFVFGGEFFDC